MKPGFILVLLKGHAKGALAYLPAIRVSVCVCGIIIIEIIIIIIIIIQCFTKLDMNVFSCLCKILWPSVRFLVHTIAI